MKYNVSVFVSNALLKEKIRSAMDPEFYNLSFFDHMQMFLEKQMSCDCILIDREFASEFDIEEMQIPTIVFVSQEDSGFASRCLLRSAFDVIDTSCS